MNVDLSDVQALPAHAVWAEMRLHMEWSAGLSLVFLFADSAAALAPIAQWAADAWALRTAPLTRLVPAQAETAAQEVLAGLQAQVLQRPALRAPVWVELLAADGTPNQNWDLQRAQVLARLNEHREWLSREFARPLVLCLPSSWWGRVSAQAPDLWHVRSHTARLGVGPVVMPAETSWSGQMASRRSLQQHLDDGRAPLRQAALHAEAAYERKPTLAGLRDWWDKLDDLAGATLQLGLADEAVGIANAAMALARRLLQQSAGIPAAQRDVSIALNCLGDAQRAAGLAEPALAAYRESLEISRALRQALGDGPQVLDDLAVSFERIAAHSQVAAAERRAAAAEAVVLRQQLCAALPDIPSHDQRLAVAEAVLAGVADNPA